MLENIKLEINKDLNLFIDAFNYGLDGKYTAALAFVAVFCLLYTFKAAVGLRINSQRESNSKKFLLTVVDQFDFWTVAALDLNYSFGYLTIDPQNNYLHWLHQLKSLLGIFVLIKLALIARVVIRAGLLWWIYVREKTNDLSETVISRKLGIFPFIINLVIGLSTLLSAFQILGYNITSLITSLGIGTIFIAFALQNVLSELFASFSVYLDKPFEIGDVVSYGEETGVVTNIGWRSTRIKTLQGESLVVPNKKLSTEIIHNYNDLKVRRVQQDLGLHGNTKLSQIKELSEIITKQAPDIERIVLERVTLKTLESGKIILELIYFVHADTYIEFALAKQDFNYLLLKLLEEKEIKQAGIA